MNLCCDEMKYFDAQNWFLFSDRKIELMKLVKIIHFTHLHVNALTHGPFIASLTNKQSILVCRGGQQILTAPFHLFTLMS